MHNDNAQTQTAESQQEVGQQNTSARNAFALLASLPRSSRQRCRLPSGSGRCDPDVFKEQRLKPPTPPTNPPRFSLHRRPLREYRQRVSPRPAPIPTAATLALSDVGQEALLNGAPTQPRTTTLCLRPRNRSRQVSPCPP